MSQSGILADNTSPSSDVETLTGDIGGAVGPDAAFNIDILSSLSSTFNINEIQIVGTPASNLLTVTQYNTITGTASGAGATTLDVITFDLGGAAAVYVMDIRAVIFDSTASEGAGYNIFGTIRTDGASVTLVGTPDKIVNEEGALGAGDANMVASGNDFKLQYTVPLGSTVTVLSSVKYTKQG